MVPSPEAGRVIVGAGLVPARSTGDHQGRPYKPIAGVPFNCRSGHLRPGG